MIVFIQRVEGGPIRMSHTPSAPEYMRNIQALFPEPLRLIGQRQSRLGLLARLRVMFAALHLGNDWYRPSPEFLEFIAHGGVVAARSRSRRLTSREALEIFRAAHDGTESYAEIGARYRVSPLAVGAITRGNTHGYLFRKRWDEREKLVYYISEAIDGAREYRMTYGKRAGKRSR